MLWITRSHVHVDRVACPWLITRFVDSDAEFIFAPASQVERVAEENGAIPFDIPGAELGHHEGRCSFEAIITKYGLKEPGLLRLAKIVHAADVDEDADSDPIARGLGSHRQRVTACASLWMRKIWRISSKFMIPCMPGAAWRQPGQRRQNKGPSLPGLIPCPLSPYSLSPCHALMPLFFRFRVFLPAWKG